MADVDAAARTSCETGVDLLAGLLNTGLPVPTDGATAALIADIQMFGVDGAKQRACGNIALPVHLFAAGELAPLQVDLLQMPAALPNPAPLAPELDAAFIPKPGVAPKVGASRPSGVDYDQVKRDEEEKRGGGGAGLLLLVLLLALGGRK